MTAEGFKDRGRMPRYIRDENKLLLDEIRKADFRLKVEDFRAMSDLWPGLFGCSRSMIALRAQVLRLSFKNGLIISVPTPSELGYTFKRKERRAKDRPTKREANSRFNLALRAVIDKEVRKAGEKIFGAAWCMIRDLENENRELKEEVKNLRPFKTVAQREFSRQLSYRRG